MTETDQTCKAFAIYIVHITADTKYWYSRKEEKGRFDISNCCALRKSAIKAYQVPKWGFDENQ